MQTVNEPKVYVHTCLLPMRWRDMDANHHVNNAVYYSYMEHALAGFLGASGWSTRASGPVIVASACTFLKPLVYPGTVEVTMYCASPGNSSFMTLYEMRLQEDSLLYADGWMKMVWIDRGTGKSIRLPNEFRDWFASLPLVK